MSLDHGVIDGGQPTSKLSLDCGKGQNGWRNMLLHVCYRRLLWVPCIATKSPVMQ